MSGAVLSLHLNCLFAHLHTITDLIIMLFVTTTVQHQVEGFLTHLKESE